MGPIRKKDDRIDRTKEFFENKLKLKILKKYLESFQDCARAAVNFSDSIWIDASTGTLYSPKPQYPRPVPMDIRYMERAFPYKNYGLREHRVVDLKLEVWFECRKVVYQPQKHLRPKVNNLSATKASDKDHFTTNLNSDRNIENWKIV